MSWSGNFWIKQYPKREINMNMTPSQEKAINSNSKSVLILAGAGSGKTATTISKIAKLIESGINPSSVLCLTFTRKAANEMKERLSDMIGRDKAKKIWAGTFHSICYRILMQFGNHIGYQTNGSKITVITADESNLLMKKIIENYGYKGTQKEISDAKNLLAHKGVVPENPEIARIIKEYYTKLRESNSIDYDKLLLEVSFLFQKCNQARDHYHNRFKYIFVDEYQDTDTMQYSLHELINPDYLFVVGDVDQSIYSFRGAEISIIQNFKKDHKESEVILLEECFRCCDSIVEKANKLISHNKNRFDKKLIGKTGKNGLFEVYFGDAFSLANYVSENLAFEMPGDIAVIGRTHNVLKELETAFFEIGLDTHRVGADMQYIEQSAQFQKILCLLRLNANVKDNIAFMKLSQLECFDLESVWQSANLRGCSWFESYQEKEKYKHDLNKRIFDVVEEILINCQIDSKIKDFFDGKKDFTGIEFLEDYQIRDQHYELEKKDPDKITLITAHAAKGLEWKNVVIAEFTEKCFPSVLAVKSGNIEEERRLAYVSFTRAAERLVIFHGKNKSCFLGEI